MDCYDEKIKTSDTFKASTTYRNDYKKYCEYNRQFYNYEKQRQETPNPPPEPPGEVDHETFSKWQEGVHIPFDVLLFPKPIIQTDPRKPFRELEKIPNRGREEAIKTRPRVYMTPAVVISQESENEVKIIRQILENLLPGNRHESPTGSSGYCQMATSLRKKSGE